MPATDRPALGKILGRGLILLDAAMGTRLIARGLDLATDDPALWALDHPEIVQQIHELDVRAGSQALLTNTFGANRVGLDRFGRGDQATAINRQAVALARVVGPDCYLIGSIGPTASNHPTALNEQAEALVEAGVDALILETHRLDQAEAALVTLRGAGTPILASLYEWPDPIERSARRLIAAGASAIGANCLPGMGAALALARKLRAATDHPIVLQPSAGLPGSDLPTLDEFRDAVAELIRLDVSLVGGCCGTTEAHVAAHRAGLAMSPPGNDPGSNEERTR